MARTSTKTGPRRSSTIGAHSPWPTRREREGGVARRVADATVTDRIAAVGAMRDAAGADVPALPRHSLIPQQRPAPARAPAPAARPGTVPQVQTPPAQDRSDTATDALLATVPPFGTPPFGTRGPAQPTKQGGARPQQHRAAAGAQPQWARRLAPVAPRNGFGVAALCLALLTLGVGVAGLVILVRATGAVVGDLEDLGVRVPAVAPASADTAVTGGPAYTFRLSGSAPGATIVWSVDGSSGGDQASRLPWDRTISGEQDGFGSTTLTAYTNPGSGGDLTCTIVGSDGRVLDTRTATAAGGVAGSAAVTCSALG